MSSSVTPTMSIRQRIFCEVCLKKMKSDKVAGYVPAAAMLDPQMPEPEQNLGRLKECKPDERNLWSRGDRFKVSDLVAQLPDGCPKPRRLPLIDGKLSMARRICKPDERSLWSRGDRFKVSDLVA